VATVPQVHGKCSKATFSTSWSALCALGVSTLRFDVYCPGDCVSVCLLSSGAFAPPDAQVKKYEAMVEMPILDTKPEVKVKSAADLAGLTEDLAGPVVIPELPSPPSPVKEAVPPSKKKSVGGLSAAFGR
jgi:hypothetical protein